MMVSNQYRSCSIGCVHVMIDNGGTVVVIQSLEILDVSVISFNSISSINMG